MSNSDITINFIEEDAINVSFDSAVYDHNQLTNIGDNTHDDIDNHIDDDDIHYVKSDIDITDLGDVDDTDIAEGKILKVDSSGNHIYVDDESGTDEKVKIDEDDPLSGYLIDKLVGGSGISIVKGTGDGEGTLLVVNDDKGSDVDLSGLVPYTGADDDVDLGANNLTVDTDTLYVDSVNNRVGIGTPTPIEKLDINGNVLATGTFTGSNLSGTNTGDQTSSDFDIKDLLDSTYLRTEWSDKWDYDEDTIKAVKVDNAGDSDTVGGLTVETAVPEGAVFTDEKVKYDSEDSTAGYLADKIISGEGISLSEGTGGDANKLVITNDDKGSDVDLSGLVPYTGATGNVDLGANNLIVDTDTLYVDSDTGNVGIGTDSPTEKLEVDGNVKADTGIFDDIDVDTDCSIFKDGADLVIENRNAVGDLEFRGRRFGVGVSPERFFHVSANSAAVTSLGLMQQLGTGDASMGFQTPGAGWSMGVDQSDGNSFKISQSTTDLGNNNRVKMTATDITLNINTTVDGDLTTPNWIYMKGNETTDDSWRMGYDSTVDGIVVQYRDSGSWVNSGAFTK